MQPEMMVVIPINGYKAMLTKCDATRREYALIKNGIIRNINIQGREEVEILCSPEEAKEIVDSAATECPEVAPFVRFISPESPAV